MRPVDVLCHLPHPDPFLQVEVHATSVGDQPDGRIDAYRPHPLLHAGGLEVEDASHLQDLQLIINQCIVFCKSNKRAEVLSKKLN